MYTKFLLTILTVLSFMMVAYSQFSQPKTIEPFAGLNYSFGSRRQTMVSDGSGCTDTYTDPARIEQYNGNMAILPQGGSSQNQDYTKVVNDNTALTGVSEEKFIQQPQNTFSGLHNPGVPQEGYVGPDKFFTVPGTKQSDIAPRFQNTDFGANITYNFPAQEHMAAIPDNPLTLAKEVENFEQQEQENYENVETKFAEVHEAVPLPATMDGPVRENYEQGSSVPTNPVIYDRMIITTGSNTSNTNTADPIRGDLPIIPECREWFGSRYANVESLQTGALGVLAGVENPEMVKLITTNTGSDAVAGIVVDNPEAKVAKNVSKRFGGAAVYESNGVGGYS